MARKRGAGDAEQVLNNVFLSKLPESVADNSSTCEPRFGRMHSRVYDGDMCQTRDEAYQKFRERQEVAQAVLQGQAAGQQFFHQQKKQINRVQDSGGVVNLIMRNSSAGNTNRSRRTSRSSRGSSRGNAMMMTNTQGIFTAGQYHTNTRGSIDTDEYDEHPTGRGGYRDQATIKEENDFSLMEDSKNKFHHSSLFKAKKSGHRNHLYFSMDRDYRETARSTFFVSGMTSKSGKFQPPELVGTARNNLSNNREFVQATHSPHTRAMKSSCFDVKRLEELPAAYMTTLGCR